MNKILLYVVAFAALLVQGCTKDMTENIEPTPVGTIDRILVHAPQGDETRIAINGINTVWEEYDDIYLFNLSTIGYDNIVRFQIDYSTISEDGKSAEFTASNGALVSGAKYVASTLEQGGTGSNGYILNFGSSFNNLTQFSQYGNGDNSHVEDYLALTSQVFTAQTAELPTLYFAIEQSVLELDVKFKSGVVGESAVKSISLSSNVKNNIPVRCYLNSAGEFSLGSIGSSSSYTGSVEVSLATEDNKIGSTSNYKVFIPTLWDNSEPASGDLLISLETVDGKFSEVAIPAKELMKGTIYRKSIEFDAPQDFAASDKDALLDLYAEWGLGNLYGGQINWSEQLPIGEWNYIERSTVGRVISLNLSNLGISRAIPVSTIARLTALEELNLSNNDLSGEIPDLSAISSLKSLYLGENNFTGSIPASLASLSNLEVLKLYNMTGITGEVPSEIYSLTKLRELDLSSTSISGSISNEIGNLTSLESLYLSSPNLTGTLPASLGNLSNLIEIEIAFTQITGSIPQELGNLQNLEYCIIAANKLSGTIPTGLLSLEAGKLMLLFNNFTDSGNEALYQDQALWNRHAAGVLTQNSGFGFSDAFKNVYVEDRSISLLDGTTESLYDYFARNDYTIVTTIRAYGDNNIANAGQRALAMYGSAGLGLLSAYTDSNIQEYITEHSLEGGFFQDTDYSFMEGEYNLSDLHVIVDSYGKIVSSPVIEGYLTIEDFNNDNYESSAKMFEFLATKFADADPFLIISDTKLEAPSNGGNITLEITSNVAWSISESLSWMTISQSSATGNATITLSFDANNSGAKREGSITISGSGVESKTISISQFVSMLDDLEEVPL